MQGGPIAASGARLFSAKHEFAADWIQFMNVPDQTSTIATLQLDFAKERFPYQLRGKTVIIQTVACYLFLDESFDASLNEHPNTAGQLPITITPPRPGSNSYTSNELRQDMKGGKAVAVMSTIVNTPSEQSEDWGVWSLTVTRAYIPPNLSIKDASNTVVQPPRFDPALVRDLMIVCDYLIS